MEEVLISMAEVTMVELRLARRDDFAALTKLYEQLFVHYQSNEQAFVLALTHPTTDILVAVEDSVVVGTATLSTRGVPSFGLVGYIDDVVVDGSQRGQGVAKQMLEHLHTRARALGCKRIDLTSRHERSKAVQMYLKLGYVKRETNCFSLGL